LNKAELVDAMHERSGLSKSDAEKALNAFIDSIQGAVAGGDRVTLPGFGSFTPTERKARTGRNPRTGEPVQIEATKSARFSVGTKFKAQVKAQVSGR
jgi:DNA-binding protein HU-beta